MEIIVHHPQNPDDLNALRRKVAEVHAEAVLRYINKLSCPKEQKIDLINALKEKDLQ